MTEILLSSKTAYFHIIKFPILISNLEYFFPQVLEQYFQDINKLVDNIELKYF